MFRVPTTEEPGKMREVFPNLAESWNFVILFKILANAEHLGKTRMFLSCILLFELIALYVKARPIDHGLK